MENTIFLQHPAWDAPRLFSIEHANNIIALEVIYPSGIIVYQADEDSKKEDAADNNRNTGNSDKRKSGEGRDPKSSGTGK